MADALVGYTGFVGGNLRRQAHFDAFYRSTDVEQIAGRSFDLLVCAGAPAEKWKANKNPEGDQASLARLTTALGQASARRVVLISTVDVYPAPIAVDEETCIPAGEGTPYGRHRLALEQFVNDRFDTLVVRLPALYGSGLKKNVVYDLLHDNMVAAINPSSVFQFYGLDSLWQDIERCRRAGLRLVNFATEPVSVREVALVAFGRDLDDPGAQAPARYDFRTRHAVVFGRTGPYLQDRKHVLAGIREFVQRERSAAP